MNSPKKKASPSQHNNSLTDVPIIYADALMGVAVGPFVSKFMIGNDVIGDEPAPKYQIALPTNLMHALANQIIEILGKSENQAQMLQAFQQYQQESISPG